ncbi:MAG TPA: ATP synthase F1 subunit delta [Myxococcota bacterium]|nr:ATP synthase F1 subunit delta [Myxococcota bacterium]
MRATVTARRYARALFALAGEENRVEELRRELDELVALIESNEPLSHAIFRPLHPAVERRRVLRATCERIGASPTLQRFCSFLVDQRRVVEIAEIRAAYSALADAAAGRMRARVVSATPLSEEQRERLRRALAARTGKHLDLEIAVDAALLGGAIATVGDLVFDGSLRTQLEQLRASLMRGH